LVELPLGFSIDATEVTRCQYEAWLATNPSTAGQIPLCSWNESYEPACEWPTPAGLGKHPVVCVDWCDAVAYCTAAGRRLCGKIGGGGNEFGSYKDAASSQWYAACSSGGTNLFPYGPTLDESACNGVGQWLWKTVEAGSLEKCQSYPGVYDLSGNVWEWEDSCDNNTGGTDDCHIRGGSWTNFNFASQCDAHNVSDRANDDNIIIGFRCCS